MRLIPLLTAILAVAPPAVAQQSAATSAKDAPQQVQATADADLPVSLERIRQALQKPQEQTLLRNYEVRPDFSIQVAEQARIDSLMSKLDFSSGPAPAGGLYGYDQQRRLFNPTDRPLQQPYAAFSGGELITIAIENLMAKYLGGRALDAVTSAERARAEAQARGEVEAAIAEYCGSRPDRDAIQLCTAPAER